MSDSILDSTKKALGLAEDYTPFDPDIILHINSVFSTLNQLGIGPTKGFAIEDATPTWTQFLGGDNNLNIVKSYVYLRVRMLFDPPSTSFLLDAISKQILEMEWRISVYREDAAWGDPNIGELGTKFSLRYGTSMHERIRITDGKNLWSALDGFRVSFLVRLSQEFTSRPIMDLGPYIVSSYDGNDIVIDWTMTANQVNQLRSGYYSLIVSDNSPEPTKSLSIISGQILVTS